SFLPNGVGNEFPPTRPGPKMDGRRRRRDDGFPPARGMAMRPTTAVIALLALFAATPALAQNSLRAGDITVHFNAVPTTTLAPEVARNNGITRSANRALVNIAVRQGEPGADRAVPATVTVSATNLNGQRVDLRMREVREGAAIYYLGEVRTSG